jgi:hypothetical protein
MEERRVYPRIDSDWALYLGNTEKHRKIGHVKNISLSGVLIFFSEDYTLDPDRHRFSLILRNAHIKPSELTITGLKEWTHTGKTEIMLGLVLDALEKDKRSDFVRFLSRSDRLEVQAFLVED